MSLLYVRFKILESEHDLLGKEKKEEEINQLKPLAQIEQINPIVFLIDKL